MSKKFGSKHSDPTVKEVVDTDSDEEITDSDMSEEEFDLVEAMNEMTVGERKKVYALKGITNEYKKLRQQYFEELAAMELKALATENAIAEERRKIVSGEREPTSEEVAAGTDKTESGVEEIPSDDEEDKKPRKGVKVVTPAEKKDADDAAAKGGIPRFWLHTFKNSEVLDSMIVGERDEDALAALQDVRMAYVDDNFKKGFKVDFHFGENEFFTNKVLSKTFLMDEEDDDEDGGALEQTIGTDIDWKSAEKNLTVVIKQKKQRHKSGKGIRIVNKEEKVPSFFNFFRTPEEPASDCDDDEEIEMFQEQMEMDFEAGMALRSGIVYRPAHYFTGKSVEEVAAQLREQFGFGMEDDDDEEEEEETDEESEDDEPPQRAGRGRGAKGPAPKPGGKQDCKQQ